jgi:SH3-like domain-containing protein
MASEFIVSADYEVIDRAPLALEKGDRVRLGRTDPAWPGWVWVTAIDGRGSYVPEDHLKDAGDQTATVTADFHARDLSATKGDVVQSLREVRGWHWCRKSDGQEGWLPAYLLKVGV